MAVGWDGDTLVVDARRFNGKTWLDQTGKPTSDALHVTERFRRTDFGHMEIHITIDDPKVLYQAVARQGTGAPDAGQRHLRKRL
jgi:hypothetical protein